MAELGDFLASQPRNRRFFLRLLHLPNPVPESFKIEIQLQGHETAIAHGLVTINTERQHLDLNSWRKKGISQFLKTLVMCQNHKIGAWFDSTACPFWTTEKWPHMFRLHFLVQCEPRKWTLFGGGQVDLEITVEKAGHASNLTLPVMATVATVSVDSLVLACYICCLAFLVPTCC